MTATGAAVQLLRPRKECVAAGVPAGALCLGAPCFQGTQRPGHTTAAPLGRISAMRSGSAAATDVPFVGIAVPSGPVGATGAPLVGVAGGHLPEVVALKFRVSPLALRHGLVVPQPHPL